MYLASAILQELDNQSLSLSERAHLRCRLASHYEQAGDYNAASEALADLWRGVGVRPNLKGLDRETQAEVLLRAGALTGWIGSAGQIEGSQEMAKDLISESLRTFEESGRRSKVGEARSDLALCYWRAGAFDEARVTLKDALREFQDSDVEQRAVALLRRALIERASKRLNEALTIYEQAATLFDEMNDHLIAAHFHHGFANVLKDLRAAENREDYTDRALIEYAAASFHFEQAGHKAFQACVENNLGYLFGIIGRFNEAHEHLDRAQVFMTRLKDNVHLAQVDETRARILLAEGRTVEAEKTARAAVRRLEKGDELSLLAEALTTHGIALARLDHFEQARPVLERAIVLAEQTGDSESAEEITLTLIEVLGASLSNEEVLAAIDYTSGLIENTRDLVILRRLAKVFRSLFLTHAGSTPPNWTNFSLRRLVHRYEATLITLALKESGGSVTRAARLLGFKNHQSLTAIINSRHKELLTKRLPVRPRRKHLLAHPKRKTKQPQ